MQPVLDAPGSELVLPPQPGLGVHGCYWLQPSATPDVLSVSDRDTEKEEYVQEGQPLSSPAATDATMADEEANIAVSVHSSSSESPTIPSTEQPEEDDAHMEDGDRAIVRPLLKRARGKKKSTSHGLKKPFVEAAEEHSASDCHLASLPARSNRAKMAQSHAQSSDWEGP